MGGSQHGAPPSYDSYQCARTAPVCLSLPVGSSAIQRWLKAYIHLLNNNYDGGLQGVDVGLAQKAPMDAHP